MKQRTRTTRKTTRVSKSVWDLMEEEEFFETALVGTRSKSNRRSNKLKTKQRKAERQWKTTLNSAHLTDFDE